jgi:hypothetical protein
MVDYKKPLSFCRAGHLLDRKGQPCSHCKRWLTRKANGNTLAQRRKLKSTKVPLT